MLPIKSHFRRAVRIFARLQTLHSTKISCNGATLDAKSSDRPDMGRPGARSRSPAQSSRSKSSVSEWSCASTRSCSGLHGRLVVGIFGSVHEGKRAQ